MAAISGAWRAKQDSPQPYASSAKWGTGINPIHNRRGDGSRHITNFLPPSDSHVPDNVIGEVPSYGYTGEDFNAGIYGYGTDNGTADRASWGTSGTSARSAVTPAFPSPGQHVNGIPGGAKLRAARHGGILGFRSKLQSHRPITEEYQSKVTQGVNRSLTAAESQLLLKTSDVQLNQTRRGSQRSGSQSEYNAPISSRVPGMRQPMYAGGERHEDMRPRTHNSGYRRPFFNRTAGTGDPAAMRVNAAYTAIPRRRIPPATVPEIPDHSGNTLQVGYGGFTMEDPIW